MPGFQAAGMAHLLCFIGQGPVFLCPESQAAFNDADLLEIPVLEGPVNAHHPVHPSVTRECDIRWSERQELTNTKVAVKGKKNTNRFPQQAN